jgi:RNA polymerase-binding transcription factor DksA
MKDSHAGLEKKLHEEKATLIRELKGIGHVKDSRNPDDWEANPGNIDTSEADSNEVGDRIESYEGNSALVEKLETRLMEVDLALNKMETGEFGTCEVCNQKIEEDRLKANPAARTCKMHLNENLQMK